MKPTFHEFFAGGGMARAGLGPEWRCLFANDSDHKKSLAYRANWGAAELRTADVQSLTAADIPGGAADLAWASFPCQDLSLAGGGAGLKGERSGTFRPFWNLMEGLAAEDRAPRLIVLENVCGALTSHAGEDFATICEAFERSRYVVGAVVIDAALFVPQSRPRLFVIGARGDLALPEGAATEQPAAPWHTRALQTAFQRLSPATRRVWRWWTPPTPPKRTLGLSDLIEEAPPDAAWFSPHETERLLGMMNPLHRAKLDEAKRRGRRIVGAVYKRTRPSGDGRRAQRAEVRFDDLSGCLRTPAGGSSRQVVIVVNGPSVRARLITARETARLMGLPDDYKLPEKYNEAYHLTGDGVVVPVVRHLARRLFEPILELAHSSTRAAA